ncbi:hypothetical protein CEW81_11675 [Kluyvera genomosp. 3]|uniref:DUF2264 domain-containing protein n=1 Tax=Kluyvera genomosp. 3 TaxID=2774055 RepID=A0A248KI41_9ENTR|nr:hypothetical protein CEW81_11675 [Kluyvera genomosp. 3]
MFRLIADGCNPQHPDYWGTPGDFDQRCVEMAVFGAGLGLTAASFRTYLSGEEFNHLIDWLRCIHNVKLPLNNWSFFPIMVEMGSAWLEKNGDQKSLPTTLRCLTNTTWATAGIAMERAAP